MTICIILLRDSLLIFSCSLDNCVLKSHLDCWKVRFLSTLSTIHHLCSLLQYSPQLSCLQVIPTLLLCISRRIPTSLLAHEPESFHGSAVVAHDGFPPKALSSEPMLLSLSPSEKWSHPSAFALFLSLTGAYFPGARFHSFVILEHPFPSYPSSWFRPVVMPPRIQISPFKSSVY